MQRTQKNMYNVMSAKGYYLIQEYAPCGCGRDHIFKHRTTKEIRVNLYNTNTVFTYKEYLDYLKDNWCPVSQDDKRIYFKLMADYHPDLT